MKHEMNQEQVRALGTAVIKSGTAVVTVGRMVADRWTRSRALSAAVAFHGARADVIGRTASAYDVLGTARSFEKYIQDGRVNGND